VPGIRAVHVGLTSLKYDPVDDERRTQAAKQERLRAAETLQIQGQPDDTEGEHIIGTTASRFELELTRSPDSMKSQGFIDTIIAKIINNFHVNVKNIHVRYEDYVSVPGVGGIPFGFCLFDVDERPLASLFSRHHSFRLHHYLS